MIQDSLYSSASTEWETPKELYDRLNDEFHFTLDPCATKENHKCDRYYNIEQNGLAQDWSGETVFCNPPYGRKYTVEWCKKCATEAVNPNTTIVLLIPARTDTKHFHDYLYQKPNVEIRFIRGRLKYGAGENNAPFPSMIAIFNKKEECS